MNKKFKQLIPVTNDYAVLATRMDHFNEPCYDRKLDGRQYFWAILDKGNYLKLTEEITRQNAVDVAKDILFSLDPRLRAQDVFMFCSQDFADKYNEAYALTHAGLPYNDKYDQVCVEGSNNRLHIIPLYNKLDSKFIHICPKSNMLVGYDQMSDAETVMVKEFDPFILSYIATMFFGVQFESIDKRRFKVIELASEATTAAKD